MSDMMTFPDTWEEFEKLYGFNDAEEIYTNNSRLIPSFRAKQWLDHLPSVQPEEVIPHRNYKYLSDYWCECGNHLGKKGDVKYCSDCGKKVKWDERFD